jgi:hypothetical protein
VLCCAGIERANKRGALPSDEKVRILAVRDVIDIRVCAQMSKSDKKKQLEEQEKAAVHARQQAQVRSLRSAAHARLSLTRDAQEAAAMLKMERRVGDVVAKNRAVLHQVGVTCARFSHVCARV